MGFYKWLLPFMFFVFMGCAKKTETDYSTSILFACVLRPDQQEFKVVGYDVSLNKYEGNTLDFPNNGKNLTMYFLGYEDALYSANGSMFWMALNWFKKTDTNICLVQYKYLTTYMDAIIKLKKTIDKRLDIVAQQTGDFIRKLMDQTVIKSLDNVVLVGYCFGGYIAAYTSRYLNTATNQKVKALLGLDPAGVSILMNKADHMKQGDAQYVQIIHTSMFYGSLDRSSADSNIVVNGGSMQDGCNGNPMCSHLRSVKIFNITTSQQYRLVASKNGEGTYTKLDDKDSSPTVPTKDDECLVGFYNSGSSKGKFKIKLPKEIFEN